MVFRKILASKSHHSRHHHNSLHHHHHLSLKWPKRRHTLISNVTGSNETKYLSPFRNSTDTGSRKRDRLNVKIKSLRNKIHMRFHPTYIIDDTATVTSDEKYDAYGETKRDELTTMSLEELFPRSNRYRIPEDNEEETNSVIHRELGKSENENEDENDYPRWGNAEQRYSFENDQFNEDEIVNRIRSEIRTTKLNSVKTSNRTLAKATEAQLIGKRVLQQLSCQSNQLTKIEDNCDILKIQSNVADKKIDELVHENRSLFALTSPNPFRKKREREKQNQINDLKMKQYHLQQETMKRAQESGRNLAVRLTSNYERYDKEEERQYILKNAQKYQFEPDEEDNRMEIELYENFEQIKAASGNLKEMAQAFGREFEAQNSRMFDIENNVQQVDGALQAKRFRLDRVIGRKE
ncbi:Spo20p [Saccharomyces eubayanus]|uniref:Spo20p n=1 Tax=Saccharomyces eubayanus TaxID=1080349 RepID=UPI0006C5D71B|nr:SPO20-like protein [Saccharomyces eubayanus]KOG97361.1 SPO20-like protein [Saccharomyces eubayanus]